LSAGGKAAGVVGGLLFPSNGLSGDASQRCFDAPFDPGCSGTAVWNESTGDGTPKNALSADQQPNYDDIAKGIGKIAAGTGLSDREVRDRIHRAKGNLPRGSNPDVGVRLPSGEIHPEAPDGGYGDSIGNIWDEPGGFR
jgi:hypothetical protein